MCIVIGRSSTKQEDHLWEARGGATGERRSKLIQRSFEINMPRNHFHRHFRFIARIVHEDNEREKEREMMVEQFTKLDRSSGVEQFSEGTIRLMAIIPDYRIDCNHSVKEWY